MKEYTISKNDSGQRLNKFLEKAVPLLPPGLMHKYCRLKRIKVGGKRTDPAYRLMEGDLVQLYINDEFFETPSEEEAYKKIKTPRLSIVYEDEHILLADKAPGMVVHADERGDTDTLIAHIQASCAVRSVEPGRCTFFHPGTLQPDRPKYRRHCHRRQNR